MTININYEFIKYSKRTVAKKGKKIFLLIFDLYSKKVGDGNGNERVTIMICKIRISHITGKCIIKI